MTLAGTNTYLIAAPDSTSAVLVDPGQSSTAEEHLGELRMLLQQRGLRVELILLTHHHFDHTQATDFFREQLQVPTVRAVRPDWCRDAEPLVDGETIRAGGAQIQVVTVPGHTSDSVAFYLPEDGSVLTGDTILGSGSTMLDHPDGRLADYLASLAKLAELEETAGAGPLRVLPGHGPINDSVAERARTLIQHRLDRVEQVRQLMAGTEATGEALIEELTDQLYPAELPPVVRFSAAATVAATVQYLLDAEEQA